MVGTLTHLTYYLKGRVDTAGAAKIKMPRDGTRRRVKWARPAGLSAFMLALTFIFAPILASARAAEPKVAVFDFEFDDTSLEGATNGPRADERLRLERLGGELRRRLAQSGHAEVVDVSAVASRAGNLQTCGGCDAVLGRELGAKYSIIGWVQKVSNLILNVNIVVRDVETGKVISSKSVDMRGNTDESWSRALDWLIRNYLLAPDGGVF
jgi:hypothetical protein